LLLPPGKNRILLFWDGFFIKMFKNMKKAFTLIELLIVVAIIAILAAIAVPNFLEAQIRSKVSRARADMRSIATALESYAVDENDYPPNDGSYSVIPMELTTPIAFITTSKLYDPFDRHAKETIGWDGAKSPFYTYMKIVDYDEFLHMAASGRIPPREAIDHWLYNEGAFEKYGPWRMVSVGPDRTYLGDSFPPPLRGSDILYDPTNGTVSFGNILRTQKNPIGYSGKLD
jgi:general secretion pathway protein G